MWSIKFGIVGWFLNNSRNLDYNIYIDFRPTLVASTLPGCYTYKEEDSTMIRNLTSIAVVIVLLGFLGGCQAMTGRTAGENVDDATITSTVKARLAQDKAGTLSRVDVDTTSGVVALNGVVNTPQDRSRAEEVARGVGGVKKVTNNLQVQKK
jgi:hyperosmotically inducible periplasmic protein